jgi:hypothetical protein
MMTNHNKKSHFYGNFKVQITKRKQTEHIMCLSSCGKAGIKVFMESQHFLFYGHSATTEI